MADFLKCKRDSKLLLSDERQLWRLASVDEVKRENRAKMKEMGILKSDTARLLDGCVKENYNPVKQYVPNMEHMILIKTQESRPKVGLKNTARFNTFKSFVSKMHSEVKLTSKGRQAALLLSCEDKITEVICLVLYSIVQEPTDGKRQEELNKLTETLKKEFRNGRTILHCAADQTHNQNHGKYVAMCLKKYFKDGEDLIKTADIYGRTALHFAALHGNTILCRFLIKKCNMKGDAMDINKENVLHFAIRDKTSEALKYLCKLDEMHSIIGSPDAQGKTALHKAAALGREEMIEILLSSISKCKDKQMYISQANLLEQSEEGLPEEGKIRRDFIRQADLFGQTALLEAARGGHVQAVKLLLKEGSRPLHERNSDGRSALHYAVQLSNDKAKEMAGILLEHHKPDVENAIQLSNDKAEERARLLRQKKSLLLWASATGIGTAEDYLKTKREKQRRPGPDTVEEYLRIEREGTVQSSEDLLSSAIELGHEKMAWELVNRGANTVQIKKRKWSPEEQQRVDQLLKQIDKMLERRRDQPAIFDSLEKMEFAKGLAALFLNPYVKSPLTVGVFGDGGLEKSRLMFQTEIILLKTAAQLAFPNLLETEQFPGCIQSKQSPKGRRKYEEINRAVKNLSPSSTSAHDPLLELLYGDYQEKYHEVYKSLALIDRSEMFETKDGDGAAVSSSNHYPLGKIPSIMTVRYSAWHHQTESEAWAGLAVEITKTIEESMTTAQRVRCHCSYAWKEHRTKICLELFLPCLFALILSGCVALVVWKLISTRSKNNELVKLGYGSIPITILAVVWNVVRQFFSAIKPISDQTKGYFSVPDHRKELGYQDQVISDIKFLNAEMCQKPSWRWKFFGWICNLLHIYPDESNTVKGTSISKSPVPGKDDIRMIVFVDDLDRCQHTVISKVLSAVKLLSEACHINVILGLDKKMIARAMKYQFPDDNPEELRKKCSEIVQLPLVLPDTSEDETKKCLHELEVTKYENAEPKTPEQPLTEGSSRDNQSLTEHGPDHVCDVAQDDTQTCQKNLSSLSQIYNPFGRFKNCLRGCMQGISSGWKETERKLGNMSLNIQMIMANYSDEDWKAIDSLIEATTSEKDLQPDWKQFLAYHRLAWNILSQSEQVKKIPGWQMQLIVWLFYCWQWEHQMNDIIKDWKKLMPVNGFSDGDDWVNSNKPSLNNIIEHYQAEREDEDNEQQEQQQLDTIEEEKKRDDWDSFKKTLNTSEKKLDVSLDCILYFQNFRLHCNSGHLSRKW